jgi:glutamine amidotransferase
MKPLAGIVDYGMGNLHSVAKAVEASGARVVISPSRRRLSGCDGLFLPGVGHFGPAMKNLARTGLDDFLSHWIMNDKPYFGICLGLQLLFERSDEDRSAPGLGVLKGRVSAFQSSPETRGLKIPHMGWNQVREIGSLRPLKNLKEGFYAYFVHSYYPVPAENLSCARTDYGLRFVSAVARGNLFACQFHPEKSSRMGLKILENFVGFLKNREELS